MFEKLKLLKQLIHFLGSLQCWHIGMQVHSFHVRSPSWIWYLWLPNWSGHQLQSNMAALETWGAYHLQKLSGWKFQAYT